MKKGVIYLRESTEKQAELFLEKHLFECLDFASKSDIEIVGHYKDIKPIKEGVEREGYEKMLSDAKNGEWEYIISATMGMMEKEYFAFTEIRDMLKEHSVTLLFTNGESPEFSSDIEIVMDMTKGLTLPEGDEDGEYFD